MNKLQEKRSLVRMAEALGQTPDPALLEDIARLEKLEERIKNNIAKDLTEIFAPVEVVEHKNTEPDLDVPVLENEETWAQRVIDEQPKPVAEQIADSISRQMATEGTVVRPDAEMPGPTAALEQKVKYLENWISRIAATGPGGGAAQIYNLDIPVKTVTGDYTIGRRDYYVGVNAAVKTYITLPSTGSNLKDGRVIVIKDESGHAQLTPIKLVGTIDGDPNGAEIRINNGAVQLVWRTDGWRII